MVILIFMYIHCMGLSSLIFKVMVSSDSNLGQPLKNAICWHCFEEYDLLIADGKHLGTKPWTRNSLAINSAFARAYGVFVAVFPRPLAFFPLPLPFPRPLPKEALAFATGFPGAAGARCSLRAATRSLWLCGVTGFCLPKTLFRTGGGMEDMGVVTSKVNSASNVAFDQQKTKFHKSNTCWNYRFSWWNTSSFLV